MAEPGLFNPGQTIEFGPFRLIPSQQLLLQGDAKVPLGSRALDILVALLQQPGEVVTKEALIKRVWPDTFVEDSNLRVHITGLRRALGDGVAGNRYVVTVPGRGYSFVAPIRLHQAEPEAAPPPPAGPAAPPPAVNLPVSLTRVIGRESVVAALATQLAQRRLVTLVGPGGIGKTTVAVAVARSLAASYPDGAGFVDLTAITNPLLLPSTLAGVIGLTSQSEISFTAIGTFLRNRRMLLVLDSCEHVVEAAATAAEEICSGAPGIRILATSQEPLRAAGEHVYRLPPLESPAASAGLTAAEAETFPGIQLFVERAAASLDGFQLTDADAPVVADICSRLDGIALAIELAASRVDAFGVRELALRLDDRFRLLTRGRRTALPRHQTLAATLEWSIQLLSDPERTLLCRLAVFPGDFALHAAAALQAGPDHARPNQSNPNQSGPDQDGDLGNISELVSKSLVVADLRGETMHYRLLNTTRLFGLEKLRQAGDLNDTRRRHALYFRDFFLPAEAECETRSKADWLARYGWQIDNVRAALDWAFSPAGDAAIGIALTCAAVPLWVQLSLLTECRGRVERAVEALAEDDNDDPRMQLCAALGWSLTFAVGRSAEAVAAWTTALSIAERLGHTSYRLRALWGLWVNHLNNGEFRHALAKAQRFAAIVTRSSDGIDLMMADRILGTSLHYLGDQLPARQHFSQMLARYTALAQQPHVARFQFDQRVTANYFQARILWLLGCPDQATQLVHSNIKEARSIDHALSFGSVLGQGACPIALFTGDQIAARRYAAMLLDHAERHALRLWHAWARCFNGLVMVRQGEVEAGLRIVRDELDQAGNSKFLPRYLVLLGEYADCLCQSGDIAQGLETVEAALVRCERNDERWYLPELIRIKGELILQSGAADAPEAAAQLFLGALHQADQQSAQSWSLRAAISLARVRRDQGCARQAREPLSQIHGRFTEGFETADLRTATQLLTELA